MKTKDTIKLVGVFGVLLVVSIFGTMMLFGGGIVTTAAIADRAGTAELTDVMEDIARSTTCDEDGQGELRAAVFNPLNESGTEYIATTGRLYSVVDNVETYVGDVTLAASGIPAIASGTTYACFDSDGNAKTFNMYIAGSDASHISTKYTFLAELDHVIEIPLEQHSALVAKVYDNEVPGWVYGPTETTAGAAYIASASTFYSTTGNATGDSTGRNVGTSGDFDDTITVYASSATDVQFTDDSLMVAIDRQDRTDWEEISVSVVGTTVQISAMDACPSKVSSDAYDDCYELTQGGEPLVIGAGTMKRKFNLMGNAKSGVNPTDDIVFGLGTKGYYKETVGSDMKSGYTKDDTSDTYVYTMQYWTLAQHSS